MDKSILITGASGLLGKALVLESLGQGFSVFAQYHKNLPQEKELNNENCRWLQADFSSHKGMRDFLVENSLLFKPCRFLINNYGPITYKNTADLTSDDFYFDFYHNVITAFEITAFFIEHTAIEAVVNIGFADVGIVRPYKKILTYAAAKNTLQLITQSYAALYPDIRFHMVSPPTLEGAKVKSQKGDRVSPQTVAAEVFDVINRPRIPLPPHPIRP